MTKSHLDKIAIVTVSFKGHDWNNIFTVKSPTGGVVRLRCNGRWHAFSKGLLELIQGYHTASADEYRWGQEVQVNMTYRMMAEIKAHAEA